MPSVRARETESGFVERCIPVVISEGTAKDGKQAAAICHSMYRESKKMIDVNQQLLEKIQERQTKQTLFNEGILTADRWVKSLESCVGIDLCYRYAAKGNTSFNDLVKRASSLLTHNNSDMILEENLEIKAASNLRDVDLNNLTLPKNTLMLFRHVLTTPKKDRDGDVLRTQGAKADPRMLLLWQHVHTLPIGKMLGVAEHNSKKLSLYSAIVDINDLAHDAAVMIDNGMGRFSHGFRALDFMEVKEDDRNGRTTSPGGFDIKSFEIMEESLVSVPANVDSQTEEVILSLVEGKKLTSSLMKGYGSTIREKRPTQSAVGGKIPLQLDLQVTINGKAINSEEREEEDELTTETKQTSVETKCAGKPDCTCGCGGKPTPEKTDENSEHTEEKASDDKEMKICPKCGGEIVKGECQKCGFRMDVVEKKSEEMIDDKAVIDDEVKAVYLGMVSGSWEYIELKLRETAKKFLVSNGIEVAENYYVGSIGTFPDSVILSVEKMGGGQPPTYYRASCKMDKLEPVYTGTPKLVEIDVSTTILEKMVGRKEGRVISNRNIINLTQARDNLQRINETQHLLTNPGKQMCKDAHRLVDETIQSASKPLGDVLRETSVSVTAKDAMAIFISKATSEQIDKMIRSLTALKQIETRQKRTEAFRSEE